jgi:hypothetical protein
MTDQSDTVIPINDRVRQLREAFDEFPDLKGGSGGGNSGGMSEDWKESVDRQLGQLHGDVRHLLYALIGGFIVLLAGGATAYVKLSDQVTQSRVEQAQVSGKLNLIVEQLNRPATPPN